MQQRFMLVSLILATAAFGGTTLSLAQEPAPIPPPPPAMMVPATPAVTVVNPDLTTAPAPVPAPTPAPALAAVPAPVAVRTSSGPLKTVAEILQNPTDDQKVHLKGYVLKKLGVEKYSFRDATAEIRLEIEAENLPTVAIDDKTLVEILGEVEKDFMVSPEVDVYIIKPAAQ